MKHHQDFRIAKISFHLLFVLLVTSAGHLAAEIEIVVEGEEDQDSTYIVKDSETGKVHGTFWNRREESSDYGYESSITPDFCWSPDRTYVVVSGGASRAREVFLYQVIGDGLKAIAIPQLTATQAAPLDAITDPLAEGIDAIRWSSKDALLVQFWRARRVTSDTETDNLVSVWAELKVTGDQAKIVGTNSTDPTL